MASSHMVYLVSSGWPQEKWIFSMWHILNGKGPKWGDRWTVLWGGGALLCEECDAMKGLLILEARELVREGSRR